MPIEPLENPGGFNFDNAFDLIDMLNIDAKDAESPEARKVSSELVGMKIYEFQTTYDGHKIQKLGVRLKNPEDAIDKDINSLIYIGDKTAIVAGNSLIESQETLFLDDNGKKISFADLIQDRQITCLSAEQFHTFRRVHLVALRMFQAAQKTEAKEEAKKIIEQNNHQLIEDINISESGLNKSRKINKLYDNESTKHIKQAIIEWQNEIKREQELERIDDINDRQIISLQFSKTVHKDQQKSLEHTKEIYKENQGLSGSSINKIIGSMSQKDKELKENSGPNPGA